MIKNTTTQYYNEDGTPMAWHKHTAPRVSWTKDGVRLTCGMTDEQYKAKLARELRYSNMVSYDGYGRVFNAHVSI